LVPSGESIKTTLQTVKQQNFSRLFKLFHVFYAFCIIYIVHLCAIDTRSINATCLLACLE